MRGPALALAAAGAMLSSGCVVMPATTTVYDPECRVMQRRVQLEAVQVGAIMGCHGRDCGVLLVAAGATALASAVISGSIAVVGNFVYWLEEQGACFTAPRP